MMISFVQFIKADPDFCNTFRFQVGNASFCHEPNLILQYIPRNMHTVFALLCFVVVIHWLIFPYPSGLLHWHCGNLTISPVPAKQPWWIWINNSCEFIMNDCIITTKQRTTKPCAYFLGYSVVVSLRCCSPTVLPKIFRHNSGNHWWFQILSPLNLIQNRRRIMAYLAAYNIIKFRLYMHDPRRPSIEPTGASPAAGVLLVMTLWYIVFQISLTVTIFNYISILIWRHSNGRGDLWTPRCTSSDNREGNMKIKHCCYFLGIVFTTILWCLAPIIK